MAGVAHAVKLHAEKMPRPRSWATYGDSPRRIRHQLSPDSVGLCCPQESTEWRGNFPPFQATCGRPLKLVRVVENARAPSTRL
jgi:hypothetical protein